MATNGGVSLAIELSSRRGSIALGRGDELLGEEPVRRESRHDDDLMPAVERLFERIGLARGSLAEVFVSIGPGGFTGLRIATTTAKMLALATGVRVVATPTAAVVAEAVPAGPGRIAVALAAKRGRTWVTWFDGSRVGAGWTISGTPGLVSPSEILSVRPRADLIITDHAPELVEASAEAGTPIEGAVFEARNLWRVGRRMSLAGEFADPGSLTPLYARAPEAVRLWESRRT